MARSLYNFSVEHMYVPGHVLSTSSVLSTGTYLGEFYVSAEHRYVPGRVLSTASVLSTDTYLGAFSL